MTTNLEEMESAAREMVQKRDAATLGPWEEYRNIRGDMRYIGEITGDSYGRIHVSDEDATFIVAASSYKGPEHVLALLARVRELESEIESYREEATEAYNAIIAAVGPDTLLQNGSPAKVADIGTLATMLARRMMKLEAEAERLKNANEQLKLGIIFSEDFGKEQGK
jgi:hypothetical protein